MERSLELAIWDHDRIGKTQDFLGGARFDIFKISFLFISIFLNSRFNLGSGRHLGRNVAWMDGTGKEVSLWQQMLDRPNFWVEGCIGLRPSLDTRPVNQWLFPTLWVAFVTSCVNQWPLLAGAVFTLQFLQLLVSHYIQLPDLSGCIICDKKDIKILLVISICR